MWRHSESHAGVIAAALVVAIMPFGCGARSSLPDDDRTTSSGSGGGPGGVPIVAVEEYDNTFFALDRDGTLYSWADGRKGMLGYPAPDYCDFVRDYTLACARRPHRVPLPAKVRAMGSLCALLVDGSLACWGPNDRGQLGDGTRSEPRPPQRVPGLMGVKSFTRGPYRSYALLEDGTVRSWGLDLHGEGTLVPTLVTGLEGATQLVGNGFPFCALIADTTVRCWGDNSEGELGIGTIAPVKDVVAVDGLRDVVQIDVGDLGFAAALLADGTMRAWGSDLGGNLGLGMFTSGRWRPSTVMISEVRRFDAGGGVCAIRRDGGLYCWGRIYNENPAHVTPTPVDGIARVTDVAVSLSAVCAVSDGDVLCFGNNADAALGDGSSVDARYVPGPVAW